MFVAAPTYQPISMPCSTNDSRQKSTILRSRIRPTTVISRPLKPGPLLSVRLPHKDEGRPVEGVVIAVCAQVVLRLTKSREFVLALLQSFKESDHELVSGLV